ncbi:MAG TPA: hypothetical protein VMV84_00300 [Dehalococcoidales bacterium]|nr:hypothetical protein [Dehalococcoidales bacterium]
MKRTMIYLSEQTHQGLRKLAFEANTSVAELIRQAITKVYGEDIEDIQVMEEELVKYQAHPESAIELEEYLRQRKAHVSA